MLAPQSQVILRNAELFAQGKWLLVNAPERTILREFPTDYISWQQTIDHHKQGVENEIFCAYPEPQATFAELTGAIVYMPKKQNPAAMYPPQSRLFVSIRPTHCLGWT